MIDAKDVTLLDHKGRPQRYGDIMRVEDFLLDVRSGMFTDYDGYGSAAVRGEDGVYRILDGETYYPSDSANLPLRATHVVWYNR